jgi:hypothetical protein
LLAPIPTIASHSPSLSLGSSAILLLLTQCNPAEGRLREGTWIPDFGATHSHLVASLEEEQERASTQEGTKKYILSVPIHNRG